MAKQRRRFSKEFKREVVQMAEGADLSISQVAKDLGISAVMVGREAGWRGAKAFSGIGMLHDQGLARLKREWALVTRQVIGWSIQLQPGRDLVLQAVLMAVWQRTRAAPVILHSDRGTQYTSQEFQAFLQTHGIFSSMSGEGSCYDNVVAKSFFGFLNESECIGGSTKPGQRPAPIFLTILSGFTIISGATPLLWDWPQKSLGSNTINSLL